MLDNTLGAHVDIAPLESLTVNPADYADTTFQAYGERLSDDYNFILKKVVVPGLPGLGDLKLRELRILATLSFFNKPLSPIQVSELLCYDPATVTRASVKLVGEGKIKRNTNNFDTRSVLLALTQTGQTLATAYQTRIRHVFSTLEQDIHYHMSDTEKIELLNLMVKINKRSNALRALCTKIDWDFPGE